MDNKKRAQHRADQIQSFHDELELLGEEEVLQLSDEQRQAVSAYHAELLTSLTDTYDIDTSTRQKQLSIGMKIASFIGALALAASVFFLFYQFWGYLGTSLQVSILVAAPLVTLLLTAYVSQHEATGYFAKLLAMVSFACFVLNLVMLGQIFNITPSENALLMWAIYGSLLAYAFDMRLLLAFRLASESIRNCPDVTTRSPSRKPCMISTQSAVSMPTVTSLGLKRPSPMAAAARR